MSRAVTAYQLARQRAHALLATQPGWPIGQELANANPAVDWAERTVALALLALGLVRTDTPSDATATRNTLAHPVHWQPRTGAGAIDFKARAAGDAPDTTP